MARCVLSYENYIAESATVLTANGAEVSGLGINRLKDTQIRKRWRTPVGSLTPVVDADFGSSKLVDVVAWAQPNDAGMLNSDGIATGYMASTDTVRHQFDLTTAGAGAVYDSTAVACNIKADMGIHAFVLPAQISARYWRTTFNATSLAGYVNYLDMGIAWCGKKFVPAKNMQYGFNWAFTDQSAIAGVQTSGLEFVRLGARRRNVVFSFDALSASDAETISLMGRFVGTSRQVLFIPDPDDVTSDFAQPIIGRLVDSNPIALPSFGNYTRAFSLLQSL